MYLILTEIFDHVRQKSTVSSYKSFFTTDMHEAAEALKVPTNIVYKLDTLVQLKEIEVTYQEVPKDLV